MNVGGVINAAGKQGIADLKNVTGGSPPALRRCDVEAGVEEPKGKNIFEENVTNVILQVLKDTNTGKCFNDISLPDEGFEWD
jgi:hypothetical protein